MKAIKQFILYGLLLAFSCAQAQTVNLQGMVNSVVQPFMAQNQIPGTAVAIHYKGQDYIYVYGYADRDSQTPVTKDTIFELASVSKIFTTSLLATSIQEGKIKLTDPIVKYLPRLLRTQGLPIDNVRVVDLATHTASFPRDITGFGASKENEAGFFQALTRWQPEQPIGSHYLYSNVGFGLLGKVVANANGTDLETLLRQKITGPLGMTNTFFYVPANKLNLRARGYRPKGMPAPYYEPGFLLGGGALRSSVSDMLKFLDANIRETPNNQKLVTALQSAQQQAYVVRPKFNMALGWQRINRFGHILITKNGMNQGFSSFIGFSPDQKFGVVVLNNKRQGQAGKLGNQLLNRLLQQSNGGQNITPNYDSLPQAEAGVSTEE